MSNLDTSIGLKLDDNYLSIIIPVFNGGENFRYCLQSLKQFAPKNAEIIVVADGDTDGSGDLAVSYGAKVIRNSVSYGPAIARNLGAAIATGDIILFLDADVTLLPQTIAKIETVFSQDMEMAALIGSYDDNPGATNFLSQYKNIFNHYTHQQANEEASTFWGACGAIRREIFETIGGFNESYHLPSVEDIELGYRLKEAGYQIRLCKDIQIKHLKQWFVISLIKADIFQRAIPWTILLFKYDKIINDLNLNWQNRASVLLIYLTIILILLSWKWNWLLEIASLDIIVLLLINNELYRFFWQKKGFLFAISAIPWHWFYYFYGGLGFAIGLIITKIRNLSFKDNKAENE